MARATVGVVQAETYYIYSHVVNDYNNMLAITIRRMPD